MEVYSRTSSFSGAGSLLLVLQALDAGDTEAFHEALDPTLPLARHIFAAPTYYYKTGIAFLAWLDGAQPGLAMVGGLHSARSAVHLARCLELADDAGLLADPELAARRWSALAATYGVDEAHGGDEAYGGES